MEEKEELVFTVNETRRKLRISRGLTYEAIRRGEIPSIRIGGRILVPRKALEEMIERGAFRDIGQAGVATSRKVKSHTG